MDRPCFFFVVTQRARKSGTYNPESPKVTWRHGAVFFLIPIEGSSDYHLYVNTNYSWVDRLRRGQTQGLPEIVKWEPNTQLTPRWVHYDTIKDGFFFTEFRGKRIPLELVAEGTLHYVSQVYDDLVRLGPLAGIVIRESGLPFEEDKRAEAIAAVAALTRRQVRHRREIEI